MARPAAPLTHSDLTATPATSWPIRGGSAPTYQLVMAENDIELQRGLVDLCADLGWPLILTAPPLVRLLSIFGARPSRCGPALASAVVVLAKGAWQGPAHLEELAALDLDENLPLVIIVPVEGAFEIRRARALGVEAVLLRPFGLEALWEAISRVREADIFGREERGD
jgi:DNA-binding NarL/FixJ family response regulator